MFIWTLSPYSDPFGNMNCVYAPNNEADANSIYHVVVSDSDDFNAVKNISSLTQVRIRCMCHEWYTCLAARKIWKSILIDQGSARFACAAARSLPQLALCRQKGCGKHPLMIVSPCRCT